MTIPDYQTIMLPLLKSLNNKNTLKITELIEKLSAEFNLTDEEREMKLESGKDRIFSNRVRWARLYLKKAGLVEDPERGYLKITQRGREVLKNNPSVINLTFLRQFSEFLDFETIKKEQEVIKSKGLDKTEKEIENFTPEDLIGKGVQIIRNNLKQQLIENLRTVDPYFFEYIVLDLLLMMGYGQ